MDHNSRHTRAIIVIYKAFRLDVAGDIYIY